MLSAQDLISHSRKNSSLPDSGGAKYNSPDGSETQQNTLTKALDEYSKYLHEERICKRSTLSEAKWSDTENVAVLQVVKGSCLRKFGFQSCDGMFLKPEEALFLVDQGLLELRYKKLPLSLQEVYMLVIPLLPSLEYYQVFAFLCRLGFMVKRYQLIDNLVVNEDENEESIQSTELDSMNDVNPLEPMASGFLQCLWQGNTNELPLLKPSDAKNTAAILSKLQTVKQIKLTDIKPCDNYSKNGFSVSFDVYISKHQKKSELSEPNFRVVVCRYSDPPPDVFDVSWLTHASGGVRLKLAVVNQGTVSFYGMFGVSIPTLISSG